MTQAQVAGERFTKAYISALELGIAQPSMPSLRHVAAQLRVPPDWFLIERPEGEAVAIPASIVGVRFSDGRVHVDLDDGRSLGLPVQRSRKLMGARLDQLERWQVTEFGRAVTWSEIGEEIGLEDFLGMRILEPEERDRTRPGGEPATMASDEARGRRRGPRATTYAPLTTWLESETSDQREASIDEVEGVLARRLPESARRYSGPWYSAKNPLGAAIAAAGWRASVDLSQQRVKFRRR